MNIKLALNLVKGDKVLLGPRKILGEVLSNSLQESIVNGKTRSMSLVKVKTKRKGKDITLELFSDWRQEYEMFEPKPKKLRKSILQRIAKWFNMEVKVVQ